MHKTIILSHYIGNTNCALFDFCYTQDKKMFICREACEVLARKKSPNHQYVATFSDKHSPGYRRINLFNSGEAVTKSNAFGLTCRQQGWIAALGLKTLKNMAGHFYVKITPFE